MLSWPYGYIFLAIALLLFAIMIVLAEPGPTKSWLQRKRTRLSGHRRKQR